MGMFDYLRCEIPLEQNPEFPVDSTTEFQTKDLENLMWHFTIQADGSLVYEEERSVQHEINPENKWDLGWHIEKTGELITYHGPYGRYHGQVLFYASRKVGEGYEFIEYLATVSDGVVEKVELHEGWRSKHEL